jgi:hypothetical protein
MLKFNEAALGSVFKFLENAKVFTLQQVVSSLSCSTPTARLKLKRWKAYTSYNHNGRYYAMPTVPRFDNKGLWYYEDVSFSKYGNLKRTIVHLINSSPSGLTGSEIGALVRLDPRSFLHHVRDVEGIQREKIEGVYVYFSENPDTYREQLRDRSKVARSGEALLSDSDAVVILAALIKHHDITVEAIMGLPEIRMHKISSSAIREFLDRHGLLKKTLTTKP